MEVMRPANNNKQEATMNRLTRYHLVRCLIALAWLALPSHLLAVNPDPPRTSPEVRASAVVSGTGVTLNWTVAGMDVRDQEVYRNTRADLAGRERIGSLNGSARSFTDVNLASGTYYYSVKVRDADLQIVNSNAVLATIGGGDDETAFNAEVLRSGNGWLARNGTRTVYSGSDMLSAMRAAVNSLTPNRTRKETVIVRDSGSIGPHTWNGDVLALDLPSYTVLDVRGAIRVVDSGDDVIVPIRAMNAQSIEIRNLKVEGNPRYGIWIQSSRDVRLGNIEMDLRGTKTVGIGIRIDHNGGTRSRDVNIEQARIVNSRSHGVETYGVDNLVIGSVTTVDTGGSGLLLNDTNNAQVGSVHATRPSVDGGGYAGMRFANNAGPNIRVGQVTVRGGARGLFCVSGSRGITVDRVDIEGTQQQGILIEDCQSVSVNGGSVRNSNNEGVRIASRTTNEHSPASNITIQGLRVEDNRRTRAQTYGIRETSAGGTNRNRIINNDLRNGGTVRDLVSEGPGTVASGNRLTGQ